MFNRRFRLIRHLTGLFLHNGVQTKKKMDIYIGNLPYDIEEQTLNAKFAEHGKVDNVKIVMDRYSGRSKGFGFVSMSDWKEAQNAIKALDGETIEGRPLKVNQAKPREDRPPRRDNRDDFRKKRY